MNNTAKGVVEDILKEQVSNLPLDEQKIKEVAKYICERLAEKGMLQRENQVKSNEILFAIKEKKEPELIQLCEQNMYFLKERREDGSLIFEGQAGKKNATKKMVIGYVLSDDEDLLSALTKWIMIDSGREIDMMESLRKFRQKKLAI